MATRKNGSVGDGRRSSREIEREIEHTREDMDHTLDELGERLHPKHLLEDVIDIFRSGGSNSSASTRRAKELGQQLARKVKQNPIPALLCGAGLAWLLLEDDRPAERRDMHSQWDDLPEHSGSFVDARTGEPYDESYGQEWRGAAAWHDDYNWEDTHDDEHGWSDRASKALEDVKTSLADTSLSARDKIRASAAKLMSVSGRKRSEIHSQWADIPEHSGSFVDARTGEPYDESYGKEWRTLMCCDIAATDDWSEEDESTWSGRAQETITRMQQTLGDTKKSTKQRLQGLADHIGGFVSETKSFTSRYGSKVGRGLSRAARSSRRGLARAGRATGHGARATRRSAVGGYYSARDYAGVTIESHPLAVGAAMLGVGLVAGLLLPHTRQEDELMGSTSDHLKRQARETGSEALRRGEHVARSAAGAAMDEMEQQGLTPEKIGQQAREAAGRIKEAAQKELPEGKSVQKKVEKVAQRAADTAKNETRAQTEEVRSQKKPE